ncbi:MAG: hypothetical protein PVJ27_00410 [Candidatus Brocadiaceae bacterium]|jgi:pantothenate kinase
MDHPDPEALSALLDDAASGKGDARAAAHLIGTDPATEAFRGAGLQPDAAERLRLFRKTAELCPSIVLEVAGYAVRARVSRDELWRFYLPACRLMLALHRAAARRTLVGITGPGASGKSVFALLVQHILGRVDMPDVRAARCPLDGFHYPNAYLGSHFLEADGPWARYVEGTEQVPLRAVKGSPPTFDVDAFVETLSALRSEPSVGCPRYDRRIHDPVPDGLRIGPRDDVVLVEGNYLLLSEGSWRRVRELLDICLFITLPPEALRRSMVERHVRGGRSAEDARRYYERVDRRNCRLVMRTRERADLLVNRDACGRIRGITCPKRAG